MKRELNNAESIGWILFSIVMMSFLLLLGAEPTADNDVHTKMRDYIALGWLASLVVSILLMTLGKYIK